MIDDVPGSPRVTLVSDERCGQLTGQVIATLVSRAELDKIGKAVPRGKRIKTPGTTLVIEGEIAKIEKARYVHLSRARFPSVGERP